MSTLVDKVRIGPSNQTIVVTFKDATSGATAGQATLQPDVTVTAMVAGASGTFTLSVDGHASAPIAAGADAATVEAAINAALPAGSSVVVSGLAPYVIRGAGALAGQAISVAVDTSGLSNSFAAVPAIDSAAGTGATITVNASDPGCVRTGTWNQAPSNGSGSASAKYTSGDPAALTPSLATWTFPLASAGWYDVWGTWDQGAGSNAQAAPYRLYDGTTLRDLVYVDQRTIPPFGVQNNFNRQWLGRIYCATTTLKVVLSSADADAAVIADAIAVTPAAGSAALAIDDRQDPVHSSGFLDTSQPNALFSATGSGWAFRQAGGNNVGGEMAQTFHPGDTATWQVGWLAPGTYDFELFWNAWTGYAGDVGWAVYDGNSSTPAASGTISEQSAPAGGQVALGKTFQSLGSATIGSGTARLVLTSPADAGFQADSALVRPTGSTALIGTPPAAAAVAVSSVVQSYGGIPSLSIDGGAPASLTLPIVSTSGQAVIYPLAAPIASSSAASFSAPAGWASTSSGPVAATAAVAATRATTLLPSAFNPATPKTMKLGYNLPGPTYAPATFIYSDLMKTANAWSGCATDPDGWPTTIWNTVASATVTEPPANYVDGLGIPNAPWGSYTVKWDTDTGADVTLSSGQQNWVNEDPSGQANLSGATDRTRVFVFTNNPGVPSRGPAISVNVTGACRNIRIYPPGVPTDGTAPLFHPDFIAQVAGATELRTAGLIAVNTGNVVDYADFPHATRRAFIQDDATFYAPIASIALPTAAQTAAIGNWFPGNRTPIVVATSSPHGLKTGHAVQLNGPDAMGVNLGGTGGGFWKLSGGQFGNMKVIDDATFAIAIPTSNPVDSISYSGGGTAYHTQYGIAPEHVVSLANAVVAWQAANGFASPGTTLHFGLPQGVSDDCCTQLFQYIAANLDARASLRVELSNEPWNGGTPFNNQFDYFDCLGRSQGLTGTQAYVKRASEVQANAVSAFAAAGRPASQVVRTFNTTTFQYGAITSYATANGIPVDELMITGYLSATFNTYGSEYNFLTVDMVMDVIEMTLPGSYAYNNGQISPPAGVKLAYYEAGPADLSVGGDGAHRVAQSQAANYHPRMNAVMLSMFQEAQDYGTSMYSKANFAGPLHNDKSPDGVGVYGTYNGFGMMPGVGDGSDGKADNRPVLAAIVPGSKAPEYGSLVAPVGGAMATWNALVAGGSGGTGPSGSSILARRMRRTRSYPRAAY